MLQVERERDHGEEVAERRERAAAARRRRSRHGGSSWRAASRGARHGHRQRSVRVASRCSACACSGASPLESDGAALDPPASRRARELLGLLALHPGRHARAAVAARFWPDVLDASARASLRTTLHELRRALGPAGVCLVADRDTVALDAAWVDAREVEALLAAGRAEEALALRDGELLAGLEEDWVLAARDAYRERLAARLGALADAAEAGGDRAAAVRLSREQVALDPLLRGAGAGAGPPPRGRRRPRRRARGPRAPARAAAPRARDRAVGRDARARRGDPRGGADAARAGARRAGPAAPASRASSAAPAARSSAATPRSPGSRPPSNARAPASAASS